MKWRRRGVTVHHRRSTEPLGFILLHLYIYRHPLMSSSTHLSLLLPLNKDFLSFWYPFSADITSRSHGGDECVTALFCREKNRERERDLGSF
ncbi:hypothetical protein HanPI659440_Chr00c09g0720971 [Helianthus annuus]|nr:hypothetical protein HanPI659440_Chr00c09g0720971 [Helianthus annuus]